MPKTFPLIAAPLLLALSSCSQETTPFHPSLDTHQLMEWILDPAADVIWDSAGFVITTDGEQDLSPTTEEGWEKVSQNAATLAESGNLLMLPGRSLGGDWNEYSSGLIRASMSALKASKARDSEALFDAGAQIYQVCLACHNQYWVVVDESDE